MLTGFVKFLPFLIIFTHRVIKYSSAYVCSSNRSSTVEFSLSYGNHSASNIPSNCSLNVCNNNNNQSDCLRSSTPCFSYRTSTSTNYCAPAGLCSLLEPCDNITQTCRLNDSVCVINSCCMPSSVCLPQEWISICSHNNQSGNGSTTVTPSAWPCAAWDPNPTLINVSYTGLSGSNINPMIISFVVDDQFNVYISSYYNHMIGKYIQNHSTGVILSNGHGSTLDRVNLPFGLALDRYGNLYIADFGNARVLKYSNISIRSQSIPIFGEIVAGNRTTGSSFNQVSGPIHISVSDSGFIYVCEYTNHRVTKWLPGSSAGVLVAGGLQGNGSNRLNYPRSIHIDQNNTLYIADTYNNRIQKWFEGQSYGTTIINISFPLHIVVDSYNIIYVLSRGKIHRYYPNSSVGHIVASSSNTFGSYGFAFDFAGNLYTILPTGYGIMKYALISNTCVPLSWHGVQTNIHPSTLPAGWSQCYSGSYDIRLNDTTIRQILNTCNKDQLLMACRPINTTAFTVAAMGMRGDILVGCSNTACPYPSNGVGWYYINSYSWGFVNATNTVSLSPCDTVLANPSSGLCWLTGNNVGTSQCGNNILTSSNSSLFERVIYHS